MLDIRLIREKPDFVRERLATRGGGDEARIDEVLRVDVERRQTETALQQLNADRKRLSKEIGGKKSQGEPTEELEQRVLDRTVQLQSANETLQAEIEARRESQQLLQAMRPEEGSDKEGGEYLGLLSDHLAREIVRGGGLGIAKQLTGEVSK